MLIGGFVLGVIGLLVGVFGDLVAGGRVCVGVFTDFGLFVGVLAGVGVLTGVGVLAGVGVLIGVGNFVGVFAVDVFVVAVTVIVVGDFALVVVIGSGVVT